MRFLNTYMTNTAKTLIQYVKDRDNNPVATFIAVKESTEDVKFRFGWSKYDPKHETVPFSKDFGKQLAMSRTQWVTFIVSNDLRKIITRKNYPNEQCCYIPRELEHLAYNFLVRAKKYFKGTAENVKILKSVEVGAYI